MRFVIVFRRSPEPWCANGYLGRMHSFPAGTLVGKRKGGRLGGRQLNRSSLGGSHILLCPWDCGDAEPLQSCIIQRHDKVRTEVGRRPPVILTDGFIPCGTFEGYSSVRPRRTVRLELELRVRAAMVSLSSPPCDSP